MSAPTALYRHFDAADRLLYVGITSNPKRRLAEHKCRAVWAGEIDRVTVHWLGTREEAADAEREAIANEGPVFNGGIYTPTGDAMRDWLGAVGMTQSELAAAYGIAGGYLSQIMSGKRKAPLHFAAYVEDLSEGVVPIRYWLFGVTAEPNITAHNVVAIQQAIP